MNEVAASRRALLLIAIGAVVVGGVYLLAAAVEGPRPPPAIPRVVEAISTDGAGGLLVLDRSVEPKPRQVLHRLHTGMDESWAIDLGEGWADHAGQRPLVAGDRAAYIVFRRQLAEALGPIEVVCAAYAGAPRWSTEIARGPALALQSRAPWLGSGRLIVPHLRDGHLELTAVDTASGAVAWHLPPSGADPLAPDTPWRVAGDSVIFKGPPGASYALADGAPLPRGAWSACVGSNNFGTDGSGNSGTGGGIVPELSGRTSEGDSLAEEEGCSE